MKYSMIILICNAEKTFSRWLDGLLSQLNNDTEALLVNNEPTDKSAKYRMDYVAKNFCF